MGPYPCIPSGPAVTDTAPTGRTQDCTRPPRQSIKLILAMQEPSTQDICSRTQISNLPSICLAAWPCRLPKSVGLYPCAIESGSLQTLHDCVLSRLNWFACHRRPYHLKPDIGCRCRPRRAPHALGRLSKDAQKSPAHFFRASETH